MLIKQEYKIPHKFVLNALLVSIPGYYQNAVQGNVIIVFNTKNKKEIARDRPSFYQSTTFAERHKAFSL